MRKEREKGEKGEEEDRERGRRKEKERGKGNREKGHTRKCLAEHRGRPETLTVLNTITV